MNVSALTYPTGSKLVNAGNKGRGSLYAVASLTPTETLGMPWPWAGYSTSNLSGNAALPMGFFTDPTSGLAIVAGVVARLLAGMV